MAGLIPDLSSKLSGILGLGSAGSQVDDNPRIPFLFTSKLRQLVAFGSFDRPTSFTGLIGNSVASAASYPYLSGPAFRPVIAMALNPNSVKFDQPKRITKRDTMEGSVFWHFTNSQGQNNDILTLSFAGSTGNIDLRGSTGTIPVPSDTSGTTSNAQSTDKMGLDTGALEKLIVWHNLYLLTREPNLLGDGSENIWSITYTSPLFPMDITFNGFFQKVLDFTEDAKKPHSRNYSFEFTVQSVEPSLDDVLSQLGTIFGQPDGAAAVNNVQANDATNVVTSTVTGGPTGIPPGTVPQL